MVIAQAGQGGLAMPDRDYYRKTISSKKFRDQFVAHMTRDVHAARRIKDVAEKNAKTVMEIETSLAKLAHPRGVARSAKELQQNATGQEHCRSSPDNWSEIVPLRPISRSRANINVRQPDFSKGQTTFSKLSRSTIRKPSALALCAQRGRGVVERH